MTPEEVRALSDEALVIHATSEVWATTVPMWSALVALKANLAEFGFKPLQWRMHPKPYSEMMMGLAASPPSANPFSTYTSILGAPLLIDATLEESQARCMFDWSPVTLARAAQHQEEMNDAE